MVEVVSGCPKWEQFLAEVIDNPGEVEALQEFLGGCLVPETFGRMLVLVDPAERGAFAIFATLTDVLGSDSSSFHQLERLRDPFVLADMSRRRLNISENDYLVRSSLPVVKAIIAGDPLNACFKYKPYFAFVPQTKLVSVCQQVPEWRDAGISRRVLMVQCRASVDLWPADGAVLRDLMLEREGVLNWLRRGLDRLRRRGRFAI